MNLSTSVLALVIALISVVSALGPSIVVMVRGHDSRISIRLQSFDAGEAVFIASNSGDRAGTVSIPTFAFSNDDAVWTGKALSNVNTSLVGAGQTKELRYRISPADWTGLRQILPIDSSNVFRQQKQTIIIEHEIVQFSGSRGTAKHDASVVCDPLRCWLQPVKTQA